MKKATILCIFLLLAGCANKASEDQVIARVGKSILTLADLHESIPPEYSAIMTQRQYANYVERWVENEILFREANKMEIEKLPNVARQIRKVQRDIVVAEAISRLCPPPNDISEYRIQQYYEQNQGDFVRSQWEIKSLHILVPDRQTAWQIRDKVTARNFLALAREYSVDPIDNAESVPYVSAGDMLPELATEAFRIRSGGTTQPVKTSRGYYIIRIIDKQPPKSIRVLAEVREEIINRLTAEGQKEMVAGVVEKLRATIPVEYHLEHLPTYTDTTLPEAYKPSPEK